MSDQDKLPPHNVEAEQAVLGCILAFPDEARGRFEEAASKITTEKVFYDLRHQVVWQHMQGLHADRKGIDTLLLINRLRESGKLDAIGGASYITNLPDLAPASSLIGYYVDLIAEKWIARQVVAYHADNLSTVESSGVVTETHLQRLQEQLEGLVNITARQLKRAPKELVRPSHFEAALFDVWFRRSKEKFGRELPFKFPLRIRPGEMTLLHGDNGCGKSSFLSQVEVVLARQDAHICKASMEVPGETSLYVATRQLLGIGPSLDETPDNILKVGKALHWLESRFVIYDFKGITDWRHLLEAFAHAHDHYQCDTFVVDSVMRIGIEDDDYTQQGIAAARFATFAITRGVHVFLVMHERKTPGGGGGGGKESIRGSKQWTDNAHNVCRLQRNVSKAEKVAEIEERHRHKELSDEAMQAAMDKLSEDWDVKFLLSKQRWPGADQNGSRWLWYDRPSLQVKVKPGDTPYCYLL